MWMRTSDKNQFLSNRNSVDSSCHLSASLLDESHHCWMTELQGMPVEVFAARQSEPKEKKISVSWGVSSTKA